MTLRRLRAEVLFRASRAAEQWIPLDLLWFLFLAPASAHALVDAARKRSGTDPPATHRRFAHRFQARLGFYLRRPLLTWIDRLSLLRWRRRFEVDGLNRLEQLIADRAVIVVSLHTPSLLVLPFWLLSRGIPTATVVLDNGWRTRPELIRRLRLAGMPDTPRYFEAGKARPMARYLTQGRCLLVPADWVRGHAVEVSWDGKSKALSSGAFRLARMTGAAVLPVLVVSVGRWRYRVFIGQPVPDEMIASGDFAAAAAACGGQLLAESARWPRDQVPEQQHVSSLPPRRLPEPAGESRQNESPTRAPDRAES